MRKQLQEICLDFENNTTDPKKIFKQNDFSKYPIIPNNNHILGNEDEKVMPRNI